MRIQYSILLLTNQYNAGEEQKEYVEIGDAFQSVAKEGLRAVMIEFKLARSGRRAETSNSRRRVSYHIGFQVLAVVQCRASVALLLLCKAMKAIEQQCLS